MTSTSGIRRTIVPSGPLRGAFTQESTGKGSGFGRS